MFFKLLFLFIISFVSLFAQEQKVEILAKNIEKEKNIVHALEDVVLYSEKYIITADEAYYDYNTSDLELIGNITVMEGTEFSTKSGYSKLNLKNDSGHLTPMFAYTGESKIWLKCDEAKFDENYYLTTKSIVSSCNVQDPDWKIGFSSGEYNRESKFLSTYNTLFYIDKVPVFYLPYFSFSTDSTRRTGLLRPKIGFGGDEGLFYLQPIYFAPQNNWDIQLNPQIRTSRGVGLHGELRFADSPYSNGSISLGQFNEQSSYVTENDLKNDKHYGASISYDRSKLFSRYFRKNVEDGLWIDFNYLNDIDYLNTIDNNDETYDQLVQSTLNYYFKRDLDYFGLYAKYYIDTSETDNDATVQELPTFQYHRFTNNILADNSFYSVDYKSTNYTSKNGFEGKINQINAPISIYFPLLNDFLHFKATENFYIVQTDYNKGLIQGNGNNIQNFHSLTLFTELAKSYDNFYHTIFFETKYTLPGNSRKSDGFKDLERLIVNDKLDELESILNNKRENLTFNLEEYFYNINGRKFLSHSLSQSIILSDIASNEYKYLDLTNDLKFYLWENLNISNSLKFSHQFSRISKFQTSLDWKLEEYKVGFIHTYQIDENDAKDNYLSFSIDTNYVKNYNFFASTNYNIDDNYFKSWSVGWTMKKKCWDYRLAYKEERTPKLTSAGSDSINKKGIYLTFNLYPIGGISYDFTKESASE